MIAGAVLALLIVVWLWRRCQSSADPVAESLQTGYPWVRCPNGYTYNFDGSECVPSVPAQMIGSMGRVLKF